MRNRYFDLQKERKKAEVEKINEKQKLSERSTFSVSQKGVHWTFRFSPTSIIKLKT